MFIQKYNDVLRSFSQHAYYYQFIFDSFHYITLRLLLTAAQAASLLSIPLAFLLVLWTLKATLASPEFPLSSCFSLFMLPPYLKELPSSSAPTHLDLQIPAKDSYYKALQKHMLFFSPYLVYQDCQATFYYTGNKKLPLRFVPSLRNVNPHMYIQFALLFSPFLFTICLLIWFLCALRCNFAPARLIPGLVLVYTV